VYIVVVNGIVWLQLSYFRVTTVYKQKDDNVEWNKTEAIDDHVMLGEFFDLVWLFI